MRLFGVPSGTLAQARATYGFVPPFDLAFAAAVSVAYPVLRDRLDFNRTLADAQDFNRTVRDRLGFNYAVTDGVDFLQGA